MPAPSPPVAVERQPRATDGTSHEEILDALTVVCGLARTLDRKGEALDPAQRAEFTEVLARKADHLRAQLLPVLRRMRALLEDGS